MGRDVTQATFSCQDRERYREKVRRCFDVFTAMLRGFRFTEDRPMTGMEIELNLVDEAGFPAMVNEEVLADLADPLFQTELARFNVEINVVPRLVADRGLETYEQDILGHLTAINKSAAHFGAYVALVGIVPTVMPEHTGAHLMSHNPRFNILNREIVRARQGLFDLDIRGHESLRASNDSIVAEGACTSAQWHLQLTPDTFASYWNASQTVAAVQVAVGANSPFFYGKRLWAETRIPLFQQSIDTRPWDLRSQGVRPRVWFGERWISSVRDLFAENLLYYSSLLPVCDAEDPEQMLAAGGVPALGELQLHNGTIYRWNRPVYDVWGDVPHVRIENRVLPSGPTVADMLANIAFSLGLIRAVAESDVGIWKRMPFSVAEENFSVAARDGIDAQVFWPDHGVIPVTSLVLERMLPLAHNGLDAYGVDPMVRDRLLGVIEQRCLTRQNGATWQTAVVSALEDHHNLSRPRALRCMFDRYRDALFRNEPVHQWPVD